MKSNATSALEFRVDLYLMAQLCHENVIMLRLRGKNMLPKMDTVVLTPMGVHQSCYSNHAALFYSL